MRRLLPLCSMALLLAAGCSCEDVVAVPCTDDAECPAEERCGSDGLCRGPVAMDADLPDGAILDSGRQDAGGGQAEFCAGSGPLLEVGDGAGEEDEECVGRIAARSFRYALCTCDGLVSSHVLETDSFDSSMGPYMPGRSGGSVGTNGSGNTTAAWSIGGSLWSSDDAGWTVSDRLAVGTDLHVAGRLAGTDVDVTRDAEVGGGIGLETLTVGGTLTTPAGSGFSVGTLDVGAQVEGGVDVSDPCACDASELVDVAGFVTRYAADNDNATVDLDPAALANVGEETTLSLPCGRYYLDSVSATAPLTIAAEGRVALFVGGSITANDDFEVTLAEGAEVDVFVAEGVTAAGAFSLGSVEAPSRARLYVGGTGTINLSASATFAGNLYAPRATLVTAGDIEVFGAVFVRRLSAAGAVTVHYDTNVLEAGDDCDPPDMCAACGDCPSTEACIEGVCGACGSDADCCSPLICVEGACVPELI